MNGMNGIIRHIEWVTGKVIPVLAVEDIVILQAITILAMEETKGKISQQKIDKRVERLKRSFLGENVLNIAA